MKSLLIMKHKWMKNLPSMAQLLSLNRARNQASHRQQSNPSGISTAASTVVALLA
jgi:hypothetical protein